MSRAIISRLPVLLGGRLRGQNSAQFQHGDRADVADQRIDQRDIEEL
jgi:hypothetical protein